MTPTTATPPDLTKVFALGDWYKAELEVLTAKYQVLETIEYLRAYVHLLEVEVEAPETRRMFLDFKVHSYATRAVGLTVEYSDKVEALADLFVTHDNAQKSATLREDMNKQVANWRIVIEALEDAWTESFR